MATAMTGWTALIGEAEEALRLARRVASERPAGSAEQAAATSLVTRLPEFIRDLRIAARRGRSNEALYRSVFEQLVPALKAI
ncbi:MAG TPA: hypothetical protein VJ506_08390 [Candidatus Limnocylindrales bacterium]|nr:hypothetical protein [Candidatus Limnocylindrales bacterium]